MRIASRVSLAAALAAGVGVAPAALGQVDSRMELAGRTLSLSGQEQARLTELGRTLRASHELQDQAMAAARAVLRGPDAHYLFAVYELEIGRARHDDAMLVEALDVLIASPATIDTRLPGYLGLRGDIAFRAHDLATASAAWTRLAELRPNDPQSLVNLAQVRSAQNDAAGAVDLMRRGIAARAATSEPVPETWYRQWLSIAYNGGQTEQGVIAAHALLDAHPTPENWRFALVAYRQLAAPREGAEIDLLRLMRAADAFARPAEYQRLAQLLLHAGLVAEGRAVLGEGIERGIVDMVAAPTPDILREFNRAAAAPATASVPAPADLLFGQGHFAEAAAAYQAALQRGGGDSGMLGVRRGVALALAGRRAEAETAFRAAAGAPAGFYPELARFWLAWLAQSGRPAAAAVTR